ncbi:TetR/AcrR family transcriptional regulator [Schaalia odontolytica]|uniref:Transcriptional regulator BetI n=1 Tax=Schaalia odontolytica TaxID=1660 RepID=A0A2X0U0X2_9ACTO|nr:TetR/AcrR family transcriptional regulator [Schaalia odontolytica]WMS26614.1 TetR/AcrR family transcriptional regulator [Schaalia odontolytica]SPT55399.1 transcriptional regulator BetI [Schaalia odontolytica]
MPKIIGESLASHRELTRARLFEALGTLMGEQSFESITMSQIAERAGVGRTAVYNHFADKEVLLLAYMREVTTEFARVLTRCLEAEPDPLMRLRIYIRSHLQMIGRYHVKAGMGLRRHMSGRGASHLHDHAGLVGEVLIGILDEAMDRGLIAEQNTLGAVHLIHATLQGQRLPKDPVHRESALVLVETFILRGLGASEKNVRQVTASALPSGE